MSLPVSVKGRVAVLAFGTYGDVLPVAVVAVELAKSKPNCAITFITHSAHKFLKTPLASAGVLFHPISTSPVALPPDDESKHPFQLQSSEIGSPRSGSKDYWKTDIEQQHREQCLLAVEQVFDQQLEDGVNFVLFNFFALEGWHLAELYHVPCAIAAPYVVPYEETGQGLCDTGVSLHVMVHLHRFERKFQAVQPLLYERLQLSNRGEVGWGEVMHWMWPLFTDRWTDWRSQCLHLSACPLTDPVTELPVSQDWPEAPALLYGFSQAVVECPGYWPRSIHVCGFWYAPPEWNTMYDQPQSAGISHSANDCGTNPTHESRSAHCHSKLLDFLSQSTEVDDKPIFVGLSSVGSMGYLRNPEFLLRVILKVLETLNRRAVLFTSSYLPLDSVIMAVWCKRQLLTKTMDTSAQCSGSEDLNLLKDGISLNNNRLFCFSGLQLAILQVFYDRSPWWQSRQESCVMTEIWEVYIMVEVARCLRLKTRALSFSTLTVVELVLMCSGTTAAALRCGVPQIICPFVLDQFYWAERMSWIGVSPQPLKQTHLCPSRGDADFMQAVSSVGNAITEASGAGMRGRAAVWSQKICLEDGVQKFVQILSEQLFC